MIKFARRGSRLINVAGTAESSYYYHQDANGNVITLSGASGSLTERYEYLPFGEQTVYNAAGTNIGSSSAIGNPYMFTGREYDSESGLYYYRARMYSAKLGRFMQTDPLGYYDSMNLYQYCGNNPLNFVDPLGLAGCQRADFPVPDPAEEWKEQERRRRRLEITAGLAMPVIPDGTTTTPGGNGGDITESDDDSSFSGSLTGGVGVGGTGSVSVKVNGDGSVDISLTLGFGPYLGVGASAGPAYGTGGDGWSLQAGGSWGNGLAVGADYTYGLTGENAGQHGVTGSLSGSVAVLPGEVHAFITNTTTYHVPYYPPRPYMPYYPYPH